MTDCPCTPTQSFKSLANIKSRSDPTDSAVGDETSSTINSSMHQRRYHVDQWDPDARFGMCGSHDTRKQFKI
ncbi:hypothetical protein AFLA_008798 [Aspergillus flavus NRRL3357]|nr:hypothetical protein AFLA_008798 [Aspergillus flavus NRRL3357]